jgi:hypothetical protein
MLHLDAMMTADIDALKKSLGLKQWGSASNKRMEPTRR